MSSETESPSLDVSDITEDMKKSESIHCPGCKKPITNDSIILPCHTFCRNCLKKQYCPICNKDIYDVDVLENLFNKKSTKILLRINKQNGFRGGKNIYNPFGQQYIEKKCSVIVRSNLSNKIYAIF